MSNPSIFSFNSLPQPSNSGDQSNLLNYTALGIFKVMTDAKTGTTGVMESDHAMPFIYHEEKSYDGRDLVLVIFASYALMEKYNTAALQARFAGKHLSFVGYLKAYEFLKEHNWQLDDAANLPFYTKNRKEPWHLPVKKGDVCGNVITFGLGVSL